MIVNYGWHMTNTTPLEFTRVRPGEYRVPTHGDHEFRALIVRTPDGWHAQTWTCDRPLDAPAVYRTLTEAQQAVRMAAYAIGA